MSVNPGVTLNVTGFFCNGSGLTDGLILNGGGAMILTAANTYTGLTTITAGTLTAGHADNGTGTFSLSGSGITIGPNGTLVASQMGAIFGHWVSGNWPTITNLGLMFDTAGANVNLGPLTLSGGTMAATGAGDAYGTWNINNNITVTANSLISAAAFDLGGNQAAGQRTFTVSPGATLSVTGYFRNGGNSQGTVYGITLNGGGTMVLAGSDTYTGPTDINAGILALDNSAALAGGGNVTFAGGTLQFSASNTVDYSTRIKGSTAAIALDTNGQNVDFAGSIDSSNSADLTKLGSGTLILSGTDTYGGGTIVTRRHAGRER